MVFGSELDVHIVKGCFPKLPVLILIIRIKYTKNSEKNGKMFGTTVITPVVTQEKKS